MCNLGYCSAMGLLLLPFSFSSSKQGGQGVVMSSNYFQRIKIGKGSVCDFQPREVAVEIVGRCLKALQ